MEKVLHPSLVKCLSSLSIRSPHLHRKLWMEQKKAIRATTLIKALGKPTLTSAQAKRVDVLGIKFEDESLSGEHHHGGLPYSLERPIASHCRRSWKRWGTPARRALSLLCLSLLPSLTAANPPKKPQIAIDLIDVVLRVLIYRRKRGGADNWQNN